MSLSRLTDLIAQAKAKSENVEGEGGIIGEEILRRFKVIFDFSHHRMILAPNARFKEPYEEDMSGISITPEETSGSKVFRVRQVVANTPGSEAGLQPDDLITAVDGQPAASLTEGRIEHCSCKKVAKLL